MTLQVRNPILPPFFSPFQRKDPALGCAKITTASSRTGMSQGHRDVRGDTGDPEGFRGALQLRVRAQPCWDNPFPSLIPRIYFRANSSSISPSQGWEWGNLGEWLFPENPTASKCRQGQFPMEGGGMGGRGVLGSGLGFSPAEMSFPQPHPRFMDSGPPSPFSSCEKGVILGDRPFPGDPPWEGEGIGAMLG